MIEAAKYMDLGTCVLRVASLILVRLSEERVLELPLLDEALRDEIGMATSSRIPQALTMLRAMGLIEYDAGADCIAVPTEENGGGK